MSSAVLPPPKKSWQYKVVLLGDSGVGKTNIITQFVKGNSQL
jgi:GTPase SAR1 family protein